MYKIYFFKDRKGKRPIVEYLKALKAENSKESKIKVNKIQEYINALALNGKKAGLPYIKHIEDDIWELRPSVDRIIFVSWEDDGFLFLHHFTKKTQKTPKKEINQAKRNLKLFKEMWDEKT